MVAVTGTGSGLDIDGLVASLVAAEQVPAEARLNAREASITSLSTSFSSAKSAVSDFESAANKLALASTFSQFTTSSSDTTKATISATSSASLGSYQLAGLLASAAGSALTGVAAGFGAVSVVLIADWICEAIDAPPISVTIFLSSPSYPESSASRRKSRAVKLPPGSPHLNNVSNLLEKSQYVLRLRVGLCKNRNTCLLEDLALSQSSCFLCEVCIHDARFRSRAVLRHILQVRNY